MATPRPEDLRNELQKQRRTVDFDTYDITVDELVRRVARGRIEMSPSYQRKFRWDAVRQSQLIESVLLGIPVPPLFMATNMRPNEATTWEVVDGLQRLSTLVHFAGDEVAREKIRENSPSLTANSLRLNGMELLERFNSFEFASLPSDISDSFLDRPLKAIVLNDKSDLQVRYDLFERLNTGGVKLTEQEIREAVFPGPFMDMLIALSGESDSKKVVLLPKARENDGTRQDFALRFFAFLDEYQNFDHSVRDFLLEFCEAATGDPRIEERASIYRTTFAFLAKCFPGGIRRRTQRITPVNLYEAVAVGCALALRCNPRLVPPADLSWVKGDELRELSTGATNDRRRVVGRIEYARDRFLEG